MCTTRVCLPIFAGDFLQGQNFHALGLAARAGRSQHRYLHRAPAQLAFYCPSQLIILLRWADVFA